MTVHVGVAGWSLRGEQKDLFGPGGSHLARYATRFDAVEINSSFYRPHRRATYQRWADAVPRDFRFAAKLPRAITHDGRLKELGGLDAFLEQVTGLGEKLGVLLVQLPPSLVFDAKVAGFFKALRARHAGSVACEPRHASWFTAPANALLKEEKIARVAADPAPVAAAAKPGGWTGLRYVRWHGSPRMYYSAYSEAQLQRLASGLRDGDWCIFDNTAEGAATGNALDLRKLLASRP